MKTNIILSGMRPTGELHLGHFESVLKNWVDLQDDYKCNYFVADWHAITTEPNTKEIKKNSIDIVKDWLAYGVDPEKSTVFIQSLVPAHAELSLLLERLVNLGTLHRLPTFKGYVEHLAGEKKIGDQDGQPLTGENRLAAVANSEISAGFLTYPVLQAADILLYDTTTVPVGEDQLPHIELTRELARKFNRTYGELFTLPEALLDEEIVLIRGSDGRKMSKSYHNDISPRASLEEITTKVRGFLSNRKRLQDKGDPYECPVYDLHRAFNQAEELNINQACRTASIKCLDCKLTLPPLIFTAYTSYRERKASLTDDYIIDVVKAGSAQANKLANQKMEQVRSFMLMDYLEVQK